VTLGSVLLSLLVAAPPAATADKRVVLVSLGGVAASQLDSSKNGLRNLRYLTTLGVRGTLETVMPSGTWPAHASLATGVLPTRHGVVGDRWWDREAGRVVEAWQPGEDNATRVSTLAALASKAGRRVVSLRWPVTGDASACELHLPKVWDPSSARRVAESKLWPELQAAGIRLSRLPKLAAENGRALDDLVLGVGVHLLRHRKVDLLMLHLSGAEGRAREAGLGSRRHRSSLVDYDRIVGRLYAVLRETKQLKATSFVVVSDRGLSPTTHRLDVRKTLERAGLAPPRVNTVYNGQLAWTYIAPGPGQDDLIRRGAKALRSRPQIELVGRANAFTTFGLPTPDVDARAGDLFAVVRPDHYFAPIEGDDLIAPGTLMAMDGYLPNAEANRVLLVAAGARVARRSKPIAARVVDVAPTVLALLGLKPPEGLDGKVLTDLLEP